MERAIDQNRIAVSAAEAAQLLGVSRPTIYSFMRMPDFPSFKLGGRTLISVDGLREWVKKQTEVRSNAL